jgi:hypothetical protein
VFDHGFYVQGSYIFKPANVEVYASTSYVFGDQSAGYGTSDERIVGVNFFPFRTGGGFEDRTFFNLNFQPVMPITVTPGVNLIARTIVPVVGIHGPEGMRFSGVADIQQQLFFTPSSPGKLIWGVGPAFSIPTATADVARTGTRAGGLDAVALTIHGPWPSSSLLADRPSCVTPPNATCARKAIGPRASSCCPRARRSRALLISRRRSGGSSPSRATPSS